MWVALSIKKYSHTEMKILIASITDSGILRVRSELIQELLDLGHQVVVATPKEKDYQAIIDLGCQFIEVANVS